MKIKTDWKKVVLEERYYDERLQMLFTAYMDFLIESLVAKGLNAAVALDVIFHTVTHLAEEGVLPPYPGEREPREYYGEWVLASDEFNLPEFLVRVVT